MYTKEETDIIILSSFTELSYAEKSQILSSGRFPLDLEENEDFLIKTHSRGVYNKVKRDFYSSAYRGKVLEELGEKDIECVTCVSADYPETLKNTPVPPVMLYCRGDKRLLGGRCFSIVGSRRSTPKALAECAKFAQKLSSAFTIVSGMAEGADKSALESALEAGGKVISVLAYGFGFVYPACNARLMEKAEECGLLITEHPPGVRPQPYFFPVRNRIIAGLSCGTLVVSAGIRSGALTTAGYAAEYGRDVFAFPYSPGMTSGEGCNRLIKDGAYLTDDISDIALRYGLNLDKRSQTLSEAERKVYEAVKAAGEMFIPDLAEALNKSVYEITPVISLLEIKKLVIRLAGNKISAVTQ